MDDKAIPVAICALVQDYNILMLKRAKGDYKGLWALPGGKIEMHEHVAEAAVREIKEELGLDSEFKSFLGLVSEHLVEKGEVESHFLLHLCELEPLSKEIKSSSAGEARWIPLDKVQEMRDEVVPSDLLMIQRMIMESEGTYYECVIEKRGQVHVLQRFECLSRKI
jgi:8-oxo-dGTP diphosphatase